MHVWTATQSRHCNNWTRLPHTYISYESLQSNLFSRTSVDQSLASLCAHTPPSPSRTIAAASDNLHSSPAATLLTRSVWRSNKSNRPRSVRVWWHSISGPCWSLKRYLSSWAVMSHVLLHWPPQEHSEPVCSSVSDSAFTRGIKRVIQP